MNEDIKSLIRNWPYNDYRHYPLLKEEQKKEAMCLILYVKRRCSGVYGDPYLPKEGMLALYRGWVENLIKRDDGYLIVAERRDRVVGSF